MRQYLHLFCCVHGRAVGYFFQTCFFLEPLLTFFELFRRACWSESPCRFYSQFSHYSAWFLLWPPIFNTFVDVCLQKSTLLDKWSRHKCTCVHRAPKGPLVPYQPSPFRWGEGENHYLVGNTRNHGVYRGFLVVLYMAREFLYCERVFLVKQKGL